MAQSQVLPVVAEQSTLANSVVILLVGISAVLVLIQYWFTSTKYFKLGDKLPGPKGIPFLGNAYMVIGHDPADMFQLVMKEYNKIKSDIARAWLGQKLYVGLCSAESVEVILGSHVHLEKSPEYGLFEPWLGDGLLISKGEKWRSHRKMIAPTFHMSILKSFMPVFNKNAQNLIEQFRKENGKIFDVHDYMSGATVDTLLETAMGVKKTSEDNTGFDYAMAVMNMCNILHQRHYKFWLRPDFIFKWTKMYSEQGSLLNTIHTLTKGLIKRKKENYFTRKSHGEASVYEEAVEKGSFNEQHGLIEETGSIMSHYVRDDLDDIDEKDVGEKKRLAFLDYMIEASHSQGIKLSDEEIKEEVNTIMFEGHDTTAAASSFFLCLLGIYPDIQEKVYEELKDIFQGDMNRPITFNDTLEMKYLERVMLETLRLYPPVPLIARKLNEDVKVQEYILPAGATVLIGTYLIHRNPKYYKNPMKFDPDNFLPEKCQQRPYYAYIPFSAGPRSCVGRKYAMLKLKVLLADTLRKFKIICMDKESDFKLQGDIILKRKDGFKIKVEDRV